MSEQDLNKFRKIRRVGHGAFGNCVLCDVLGGAQQVVLKKMKIAESAINEARLLTELRHANIIEASETFRSDRSVYIVLEYMEGGDLDAVIREHRDKPFKDRRIQDYCLQIAEALKFIHSRGVVHRDVKPVNVLLNADRSVVKLADFGISVHLPEGAPSLQGHRVGTSSYMAPEILQGSAIDFKCDIWGLGCILYELIERRRAFDGSTDLAIQRKAINRDCQMPKVSPFLHLLEALLSTCPSLRPTAEGTIAKLTGVSLQSSNSLFSQIRRQLSTNEAK